jgi:hypothetical protein
MFGGVREGKRRIGDTVIDPAMSNPSDDDESSAKTASGTWTLESEWTARSELTAPLWDFIRKPRKTNIAFQGGRTTCPLTPGCAGTAARPPLFGNAPRFRLVRELCLRIDLVIKRAQISSARKLGG